MLARFLLLLVLLITVGVSALVIWDRQEKTVSNQVPGDTTGFRRSVVYELSQDQWTAFPLPQTAGIRVLNTPLLSSEVVETAGIRWNYALEFQLLDRTGKVLREWLHHYRPGMVQYLDPETGQYRPKAFVEDMLALPIGSRATEFEAADLQDGEILRVRIKQGNPSFAAILVRAYVKEKQAEHRLTYLWERLDENAQQRLADVSVYGSEYLREREKINLLRWRWRPIGPAGIQGEHYRQRALYVLKEELFESVGDQVLPEGIYVDAGTRGVLPIPAGRWDLILEVESVSDDALTSAEDRLRIVWRGNALGESWNDELAINGDTLSEYQRNDVEGGLLEFSANRAVVVRAYIMKEGKRESLQSPPLRLRTYLSAGLKPVEYVLEHIPGMLTPVRVDLRGLLDANKLGSAFTFAVQYQFIDKTGAIIEQGKVSLDPVASVYDRASVTAGQYSVTEPLRSYFRLQNNVARLKIFSLQPVAVSVYTRPPDLRRYVRAPEDYEDTGWDPQRRPAWFYLRAHDHDSRIVNQQIVDMVLQTRPADVNVDLQAGRYQRVEYEPHGQPYAKQLLVPRSSTLSVPGRSRAGVYTPIPANRDVKVNLLSFPGRKHLSPTLVYIGKAMQRADVAIEVDGKLVKQTRLFSSRARISLPGLRSGRHTVRIRSSAQGAWWLNHADAGSGAQLMRRAWRVDQRPLQFTYNKEIPEETLTATLYCEDSGRSLIEVDVAGPAVNEQGPVKHWTFRRRTYDLRHDPAKVIPVFDNPEEWLNAGQGFFLPLNADLPAAEYRIKLRKRDKGKCYMTLHRLLPGQPEIRRFFREQDLSSGGVL